MKAKRIIIFAAVFIGIALLAIFFGCPIKQLTGVDCPGCGMTRAFLSAMRFDFAAAFNYHPLFGIFLIETVYVIFRMFFPNRSETCKKAETVVFGISILLLLIVWVIRLFII